MLRTCYRLVVDLLRGNWCIGLTDFGILILSFNCPQTVTHPNTNPARPGAELATGWSRVRRPNHFTVHQQASQHLCDSNPLLCYCTGNDEKTTSTTCQQQQQQQQQQVRAGHVTKGYHRLQQDDTVQHMSDSDRSGSASDELELDSDISKRSYLLI